MKYVKSKRYRCIQGESAADFEAAINAVLTEHPNADMRIDTLIPFLCHAWYTAEVNVAETKAEEYELRGEGHYCIECPYLDRPLRSNKAQKTFPCQYANYGMTRTDSLCCDRFYEWMERSSENE